MTTAADFIQATYMQKTNQSTLRETADYQELITTIFQDIAGEGFPGAKIDVAALSEYGDICEALILDGFKVQYYQDISREYECYLVNWTGRDNEDDWDDIMFQSPMVYPHKNSEEEK